ncbi:MAG: hypothetical protein KJ621_08350 [Proteobacteria bacterium]|nr:hypothetical protein [Pseudomonadota bacterium]MBU1740101.1 hypothetical protein [Pseudomonadota bacterium]
MARNHLPGVLKKRSLLNDPKAAPAEMTALAESLATAEFLSDAVDFYRKAGHEPGLRSVLERAVDDGDCFLVGKIEKALGAPLEREVWRRVAAQAKALGKDGFAAQAAGRIEAIETDE